MLTGIFDSHAHYDDPRYDQDRESLLQQLHQGGVARIMNIGADLPTSRMGVQLAEGHGFLYAAVGVHPYSAQELPGDYLDRLERLTASPRVKAIGEIGLDYHEDSNNRCDSIGREQQRQVFCQQLELAARLELPVVVHNRDAHADTLEILTHYRPRGVVHCFSGSAEMAQQLVKQGMYVGFTGVVTFKNARRALEAAAAVPLDRLLIETDCPYLAPEPYRGKRCDSLMLQYVTEKLAELRGISPQALVNATAENAARLFGIS